MRRLKRVDRRGCHDHLEFISQCMRMSKLSLLYPTYDQVSNKLPTRANTKAAQLGLSTALP
jgi:hypothetical protein